MQTLKIFKVKYKSLFYKFRAPPLNLKLFKAQIRDKIKDFKSDFAIYGVEMD